MQTIISFYEDSKDQLRTFAAAGAKFVILSQGPLYLVGISKLGESNAQIRIQLEALYMQILSTLTLPTLNHLFSNRPSTDLRRPLRGTEVLLSALADTFTRGSPATLMSALECLKLRKSERQVISDTLLRTKCDALLYGLVVAGGRLVSVVRPRKHSLHPSDLQLIFNMLFEADGIKAGGGENWVPLCLPGFNRNGYLYMYVSFVSATTVDLENRGEEEQAPESEDTIAILLISANKESFFDLRKMRDTIVQVRTLHCVYVRDTDMSTRSWMITEVWRSSSQQSAVAGLRPPIYSPEPGCDTFYTSLKPMCSTLCRLTSRTSQRCWPGEGNFLRQH